MLITLGPNRTYGGCISLKKDNLCKIQIQMKRLIFILSISCIGFLSAGATTFSVKDEKKPGDDKKAKAKREDTTKQVVNCETLTSNSEDEAIDTAQILFPSHDLYASWDTSRAHPYNFNEAFKDDSVLLVLTHPEDCGFSMPVKGGITSDFGWRRYRPHYGTDIDLETGDSVAVAFDGMVRMAKYYYGYGNCIIVRHANGLETVYGHLSKIMVEPGQTVVAGSVIGLGGNTGRSFGSHLHFEMRYLGQALDSEDFVDYSKGCLKSNTFVLRKADVEHKYDLRALRSRHKRDVGLARASGKGKAGGKAVKGVYRVRQGDTLGAIAKRNHTTVKAICKKNGLKPTSVLRLGQKLKI
ncbi:MAG: peptidase [Bacteroidetes bacterium]|jgi:murein DD-endopeptidase MepM/ murein hydrolase activator NlpD|nr:peptidase [Bacteroidota bacterium]